MNNTQIRPVQRNEKARFADGLKIFLISIIVLLLTAILIVVIVIPLQSVDRITELHHSSNQERLKLENLRQDREDQRRELDRQFNQKHHEENLNLTDRIHREKLLSDSKHREDEMKLYDESKTRENNQMQNLLFKEFIYELYENAPNLNNRKIQLKAVYLSQYFDPTHRSLLVQTLYRENLIKRTDFKNGTISEPVLDLRGAVLNNINLDQSAMKAYKSVISSNYDGLSLPQTNMINASLVTCDLTRSNFRYSNLFGCSMSQSKLNNSDFDHSVLASCNLSNMSLMQSTMSKAILNEANLSRSKLIDVKLDHASLQRTTLSHCDIQRVDFSFSSNLAANFSRSSLNDILFTGSILEQTDFSCVQASRVDFSFSSNFAANFSRSSLNDILFISSILEKTDFSCVQASRVDFSFSSNFGANFSHSSLNDILFTGSMLQQTNFSHVQGFRVDFSNSDLSYSDFQSALLSQTTFRFANLISANFENARMPDVDLSNADLTNAKISSNQLESALTVAGAQLPDGTIGLNRNFLISDGSVCNLTNWNVKGNITFEHDQMLNRCQFQSKMINSTMTKSFNLTRYQRLINQSETKIYVSRFSSLNHADALNNIYIKFFDKNRTEIRADGRISMNHEA